MSKFKEHLFEEFASTEKRSIISGPFGSNISKKYFKVDGVPVIRGNNLSKDFIKFIDTGFVFVTEEKAKALNTFAILDDLVFTAVGTLGQVGLIHKDLKYKEYIISNKQLRVRIDKKRLNPNYAFYWFSSPWMIDTIQKRNVGSTVPLINLSIVRGLPICIPENIQTQKSIAKVLNDIDAKIELNNKINQELEVMAKTLYDYWFVQFDFPDEQGKVYKSSGGKMIFNDELKRDIPEGWEVKKLVDELEVQYGFPFSTKLFNEDNNGVPVIRIRDILKNTISLYSTEELDERYKLEKEDLIIGMDGNFHMNFWDKENCYLNQRSVRIRQKNKNTTSTFQALFGTQPYIKAREKNVSRTTVGHLSAKDINNLNVLKPNKEIGEKANVFFNSTLKKIIVNRNENQQLSELRDWILPMLMNGQVTVGTTEEKLRVAVKPDSKYN